MNNQNIIKYITRELAEALSEETIRDLYLVNTGKYKELTTTSLSNNLVELAEEYGVNNDELEFPWLYLGGRNLTLVYQELVADLFRGSSIILKAKVEELCCNRINMEE